MSTWGGLMTAELCGQEDVRSGDAYLEHNAGEGNGPLSGTAACCDIFAGECTITDSVELCSGIVSAGLCSGCAVCDRCSDTTCDDCNLDGDEDDASQTQGCVAFDNDNLNGLWSTSDGANWSSDTLPTTSQNVTIPDCSVQNPTALDVTLDFSTSVQSLRVLDGAGLTLSGEEVVLSLASTDGSVFVRGGSVAGTDASNLLLADDAEIDAAGMVTIAAGGFFGPDQTPSEGKLSASSISVESGPNEGGLGMMMITSEMAVTTTGNFTVSFSAGSNGTPPCLQVDGDGLVTVGNDFAIVGDAEIDFSSSNPMYVGRNFVNKSRNADDFKWLSGSMVFGGQSFISTYHDFEVAGEDMGATPGGYTQNFAMGEVAIGEGAHVTFKDDFDNDQNGSVGQCCANTEALYVDTLDVHATATLTIDNCRVYYKQLIGNNVNPTLIGCGEFIQVGAGIAAPLADTRFDADGNVMACTTDADCSGGESGSNPNTVCRASDPDGSAHACYVARQRYLSIVPNPENEGTPHAYRVSVDVGDGDCTQRRLLGFTQSIETVRSDNDAQRGQRVFHRVSIGPVPEFADYSGLEQGYVHVAGCDIGPGDGDKPRIYCIQSIREGEDLGDESKYSPHLILPTPARFADVTGGGPLGSPPDGLITMADVHAIVRGFQNKNNEPLDWLILDADRADMKVSLADAFLAVLAFQGAPLPSDSPENCPVAGFGTGACCTMGSCALTAPHSCFGSFQGVGTTCP